MSHDFLRMSLMGADGINRFTFGSEGCPVRLHGMPQGLQGADFELDYQQNARQWGETFKGRRDKRNIIKFTAAIGDGRVGPHFRHLHNRWRSALGRGDTQCRFVVVSAESGYRWKDCRLQAAVQANDWQRPGLLGEHLEEVTLASDETFWTHPDRTMLWTARDAGNARFFNDGDQPAWLRYTFTGPCAGYIIGLGTDRVQLPPIAAGSYIRIDTDPSFPTAMHEDGRDLYRRHPEWMFREALPPGGPHPLGITPIAPEPGAAVLAEITPRSERAW